MYVIPKFDRINFYNLEFMNERNRDINNIYFPTNGLILYPWWECCQITSLKRLKSIYVINRLGGKGQFAGINQIYFPMNRQILYPRRFCKITLQNDSVLHGMKISSYVESIISNDKTCYICIIKCLRYVSD